MQIVDRGVGFDTQCAVPSGVGLVAIRERLKLVNGDRVIDSRPGGGIAAEAGGPLRLAVYPCLAYFYERTAGVTTASTPLRVGMNRQSMRTAVIIGASSG